ncbi:MAG: ATP-binding protein [Candidatus Udaeobacter sp.]
MKGLTFRARVALWSVAVGTVALTLFGAGAAWNLRRELLENVDQEIKDKAEAFGTELDEQRMAGSQGENAEVFSAEDLAQFPYVEVRDGRRLLYRSPALGNDEVFPRQLGARPIAFKLQGHTVRFRVFRRGNITFALGKDLQAVDEALTGLLRAYLITLPLVALAVGAGGWLIADRAVVPIRAIIAQTGKISASDLDQRMPAPPTQDEIGHLTKVLNEMFDRLQRSFEQVTRFTSDASHELKMPLALIRAEVETALDSPDFTPSQHELLSHLIDQCTQLSQIVDGLLFLSGADDRRLAIEQTPVDLVALVRELIEDAEILAAPSAISLECKMPAELMVPGDIQLLRRAVMNLIDNAIKYNTSAGTVILSAVTNGANAILNVRNTGPGLPPEAQARVFHRFYRSDLSHNKQIAGHGLGLSLAREIARAHGGDVTLVQSDSHWTEFSIALPFTGRPSQTSKSKAGARQDRQSD